MTTKKVKTEAPKAEAPKTSVGAKLLLDRVNQLQEENDSLKKIIGEMTEALFLKEVELDQALDIVIDAAHYEINFFSPKYFRNAMKLQEKAAIYVAEYYLNALGRKGR